jgi:UDP-N-acetylmuramyl pentapeptide phosphotransferase/UDP-N-acetylglucosamine-1-phosphate transferase
VNFTGKVLLGNVGSFSIGITLAVYAILMNLKLVLLISLAPFIVNSLMILLSRLLLHQSPRTKIDGRGLLYADNIRSLRTLILYHRHLSERQTVLAICLTVTLSVLISLLLAK